MTEYSGIYHTKFRSSLYGTLDLNESFQCSASQASLNMWGAHDSSFVEDDQTMSYSNNIRTPTGSFS